MSLPGPSSLGRIAACPSSEALPHVRSSTRFTYRGDGIHAFLKSCNQMGRDAALSIAEEDLQETLEAIPLDRLPPLDSKQHAAEVSFAFDVATGDCRELGRGLERDHARALAKPEELVGTADLVGVTADAAVIYDWKTGYGHIDPAEVNWQVKTYCLQAARTYGRDSARGSIVRILDDGSVWYDTVEMDSLDLDAHEAELRGLLELRARVLTMTPDQRPSLHEGEHCRYCPALPHCPAKLSLLQAAFSEAPLAAATVELTPERAASAWAKLDAADKLLERLREVVKAYARQQPFPTGDGWQVGEVTEHKETIVADRARTALEQHLGQPMGTAVFSACSETKEIVTKAKLRTALSRFVLPSLPKERAKITHVERDTLEALRKAGAISVASYNHVKEHKAKELPPAEAKEEPAPASPEKTQLELGAAWQALSPEAKIDYGRGKGTLGDLAAQDLQRRQARDARIRACEERGFHNWGQMSDCLDCAIHRPPMDQHVDKSTGHPIRHGVKLCSCVPGARACVEAAPAVEASP